MSFTPFFDRSLYTVQILFVSKIPRSQFTQKRSTSDRIEAKHDLVILCFGTISISTTAFRHQTISTTAFWHLFISTTVRLAPFTKCLRPQLFLICSPIKNSIINLQLHTPILMGDVTNFQIGNLLPIKN